MPRRWKTCVRRSSIATLLMSLVEKYGYAELAAALKERDGWPDPELQGTGGVEELDDFSKCKSPERRTGAICTRHRSISAVRRTTA